MKKTKKSIWRMEMSNWSFAMNERCYENDYIRARAHILSHSQYHHGLLLSLSLSRFIDDEFSILILSFGTLAKQISRGLALHWCGVLRVLNLHVHSVCTPVYSFLYIQCAMCMSTNTVQSFNVHCTMFSVHIRSYHRSYHRLSLDLCSTFFVLLAQNRMF